METVEKVIANARKLSRGDRLRLLEELGRTLHDESPAVVSEAGPYAPLIALAGAFPADFSDVSTDKHRHLGPALCGTARGE